MSLTVAELEEIAAARLKPQRVLRAELRAVVIQRMAGSHLQLGGALYLAQRARCFHCAGPLPIFARSSQQGATTREHVLPAGTRPDDTRSSGACVLAHRICNQDRAERPFTLNEWHRAVEIWTTADAIWSAGGRKGSQFPHWIELANTMRKAQR